MNKIMCRGVGAAVALVSVVAFSPSSEVRALSYPNPSVNNGAFPVCATADQEFCVEKFEFTPQGGQVREIPNPTTIRATPGEDPSITVAISGAYSGPDTPAQMGPFLPALSINYYDADGSFDRSNGTATTLRGLADGLYRVVVRTGDYDPTYMMLTGKYESYVVTKGADGYFTIDIAARPSPTAKVVQLNGDMSRLNTCIAVKWLDGCEANQAYEGYILTSFAMMNDAATRESFRESWIASNASLIGMESVNLTTGEFDAKAQSPHYVPTDFPTAGLTQEGSRYLNPANFEMFVRYTTLAEALSKMTGQTVTEDQVKTLVANPTAVMEGTIEEAASAASAVQEKVKDITVTADTKGVRVNFNLTHYSAPNPSLKLKKTAVTPAPSSGGAAAKGPESVPSAAPVSAPSTAPSTTTKKLSNGATLKILSAASKGTTYTAKSLVSPSAGAKVKGVKSTSPSVCSTKKTSVKMLKAGTCKLAVKILAKKKVASVPVKINVS